MTKPTTTSRAAAICALGLLAAAAVAQPARAGTLENLERERAILIGVMLEADLTPEERFSRMTASKRRLVDLERMVLRDKSLTGRNTPAVRRAFQNYDLTFLVHASTEKNMSMTDAWLAQIGVTTQSLMSARSGRR